MLNPQVSDLQMAQTATCTGTDRGALGTPDCHEHQSATTCPLGMVRYVRRAEPRINAQDVFNRFPQDHGPTSFTRERSNLVHLNPRHRKFLSISDKIHAKNSNDTKHFT